MENRFYRPIELPCFYYFIWRRIHTILQIRLYYWILLLGKYVHLVFYSFTFISPSLYDGSLCQRLHTFSLDPYLLYIYWKKLSIDAISLYKNETSISILHIKLDRNKTTLRQNYYFFFHLSTRTFFSIIIISQAGEFYQIKYKNINFRYE